jgi:hypothetical protein
MSGPMVADGMGTDVFVAVGAAGGRGTGFPKWGESLK